MNVNTELLEYIYQSSEMGVLALTNLLKELNDKENKLKPIISDELSTYEEYQKKSKKLLVSEKVEPKENSFMAKMTSRMAMSKEIKSDNSDASIAHLLIEGFTMGVVDMESKIKNFHNDADKKVLRLAEKYLKFQQTELEKLKKYL
jgi:hypothetical protein